MPRHLRSPRRPCRLPCLLGLLLSGLTACSGGEAEQERVKGSPVAPTAAPYVGLATLPRAEDRRCEACHEGITARWRLHGMANSLGALESAGLSPALPSPWLQNPSTGFAYRFEAAEGGGLHFEQTRPAPRPDLPPHQREAASHFRIGAGVADLSLVLRIGNAWRFAPLEYLRELGWVPAPQELGPEPPGLRHGINADCLVCHSPDQPPAVYPKDALGDFTPRPIGCATCHGNADEHVRRMEEDGFDAELAILNPRDLPPARQLDLCARCHLEGDARLDRGGGLSLPAPGSDLLAGRAVMVGRHPTDDLRFVSQVRRLALSACFRESPEMSCTSCHDPHLPARLQGRETMIARCLRCHEGIGPHGQEGWQPPTASARPADCIDCHMPRRRPLDLLEVEIHDHFIRSLPTAPTPPGPLRFLESPSGDWLPFRYRDDGDQGAAIPAADESQALVALARATLLPSADTRAAARRQVALSRLPQAPLLMGILEARDGDSNRAEADLRLAVSRNPEDAEALAQLALLLASRAATAPDRAEQAAWRDEAASLSDLLAERYPEAAMPWRIRFLLAAASEDMESARHALQQSLARDPDQAILWQKLGRLEAAAGHAQAAQEAFLEAYRWDPDLPGLPQDLAH